MINSSQTLITLLQNLTSDISTETILRACLTNKQLATFCDTDQIWIQLLKRDYNFDYYVDSRENHELGYCDFDRYRAKDIYTQLLIDKIVSKLVDVDEAYILINTYDRYLEDSIDIENAKEREDFIDYLLKLLLSEDPADRYVCINNIVVPTPLLDDIEFVIRNDPEKINPGSILALLIYYDYLTIEQYEMMQIAKDGEYNKYGMNFS